MPGSLRGGRRPLLVFALLCAIAGGSAPATAAEPDDAVDAARADFAEGQGYFQSKRWADALKSFEHSYDKVPSPNAELMVARCLRELGRGPDAAVAYREAEAEARKRIKQGESKYSDTAEAAFAEGSAVRANLGTMKVHVARANGATLLVDRKPVALSASGDATVLHEPGAVPVTARNADGAEQRQTVTVVAGNTVETELAIADSKTSGPPAATKQLPPPTNDTSAPDEPRHFPSWFWPATIAAGGVTVAAMGLGFGFGASSKSTFEALRDECGPTHCVSALQRSRAADGKDVQTVANISFGVAIAGAVATAVLLYLGLTSERRPSKL